MASYTYVTLVPFGGTPVHLADQTGAPFPTTGSGALVFANGATLTSPIIVGALSGASFISPTFTGTVAGGATYVSISLTAPALGTPVSGNLASCVGYPASGLAGLGAGVASFLGTPTSANLAAALTDETGSGAAVFGTSPVVAAPTFTGAVAQTSGTFQFLGLTTGLVNVMAATPSPALTAYTTGAFYFVQANLANTTTTPTINISGLGAKTIVKRQATALAAGDYLANMFLLLMFDGVNMVLINPVVN